MQWLCCRVLIGLICLPTQSVNAKSISCRQPCNLPSVLGQSSVECCGFRCSCLLSSWAAFELCHKREVCGSGLLVSPSQDNNRHHHEVSSGADAGTSVCKANSERLSIMPYKELYQATHKIPHMFCAARWSGVHGKGKCSDTIQVHTYSLCSVAQTFTSHQSVQEDLDDRFKWDPSNARWVRVKPGKDEGGVAPRCMPMS